MFEVMPELIDYLSEVACLERPYAKHILEIVSRKVDEAAQGMETALLHEGCGGEILQIKPYCKKCRVVVEPQMDIPKKRAADETLCACKDEAFINDETLGCCGNCGKPFHR